MPTMRGTTDDSARGNLEHIRGGNVLDGVEVRRQRADGVMVDLELYAAPLKMSDGRTHILSIITDITERKRRERGRQRIADANRALAASIDLDQTLRGLVSLPVVHFADWCASDRIEEHELNRLAVSREEAGTGIPVPRRLSFNPARGGPSLDALPVVEG